MNQSWVAIYGRAKVEDGVIEHVPTVVETTSPSPDASAGQEVAPHTLVKSNLEFEEGTIAFEAILGKPDAKCQVGILLRDGELFAGLNVAGAAYGFAVYRNAKWEPAGGAGFGDTPTVDQWLKVILKVRGSTVDLYINDVRVAGTTQATKSGQISFLFQSVSPVRVRNVQVTSKSPVCFVVMQFTEEYNALYREVIKPTCESFGYAVLRADDFYTSGLIIEDITRSIRESALVIADVTPDNSNVFYEVGYAHGIGKSTILLSDRKRDRLPFDISGFRTLFYDNTIGGKSAVEERLRKHLESMRD